MKINKKVYPDYPRFMCSVQSLHLADDDYDLVAFDESKTILSSFGGEATTHLHGKNHRLIEHWNKLQKISEMLNR